MASEISSVSTDDIDQIGGWRISMRVSWSDTAYPDPCNESGMADGRLACEADLMGRYFPQ
jgi:hypothetical protein